MDPIIAIIVFSLILLAGVVCYFIKAVQNLGTIILGIVGFIGLLFYIFASGNVILGSIIFGIMIVSGIVTYFVDTVDNWVSAVIGFVGLIFLIILLFF